MLQGFINQTKREIRYYETLLTEHQDKMSEQEINEVLDKLDNLYETIKMLTS